MELPRIDIAEIAQLASEVAINGAIRLAGAIGDDTFEYLVGIAVLIYETHPDG